MSASFWIGASLVGALAGGLLLLRRGMSWGALPDERSRTLPGDEYLEGGPRSRVAMTRAISIDAPPERVWPWIAQMGRGAGWYSIDGLDNGRRVSAWHIVSWIPEPRRGDATAIGYLRHIEPDGALAWWLDGGRFAGATVRVVACYAITPDGAGTRLVSRMSADAVGATAQLALFIFRVIDSIMASRQLVGMRNRVAYCDLHPSAPKHPETGDRGQYQLYEVLYADGEGAGTKGKEHAVQWRRAAIVDGVLEED